MPWRVKKVLRQVHGTNKMLRMCEHKSTFSFKITINNIYQEYILSIMLLPYFHGFQRQTENNILLRLELGQGGAWSLYTKELGQGIFNDNTISIQSGACSLLIWVVRCFKALWERHTVQLEGIRWKPVFRWLIAVEICCMWGASRIGSLFKSG